MCGIPVRKSRILKKLRAETPVLLTTLHLTDASLFELASLMGFDGIWFDMEHHAHSMETAQTLMRAARVGRSDMMVRPAKGEFMRMGRALEAGAQGILYPRCDNAAEAAEVVKWAKFPPFGKRGCDGGNPDMPYCTMPMDRYIKEANEQTFVAIQIEEEAALDHVEEIAAVPGVDVIFLGPGDFSSIGGYPGEFHHPKVIQAAERINAATKRAGIHWGQPALSLEHAKSLIASGARLIAHGSDIVLVKLGLEAMQQKFAKAGFTFDNQLIDDNSHPAAPSNGAPRPLSKRSQHRTDRAVST